MRLKADLILLLTALIWGFGFIAQRTAAVEVGAMLFNGARWTIGALFMLPFIKFKFDFSKSTLAWTASTGALLFLASGLQQTGLATTTAGNAGFITGSYVVIIPILLMVFWREKVRSSIWIAVAMTALGIYLLSTNGPLKFQPGDWFVLAGSFMWALHVIITGKAVQKVHFLQFVAGQYLFCAILNIIFGLIFQSASLPALLPNWISFVYLGIFSTGIGFTLQAFGQRHAPAADAAIIMSMEAVFAALSGWLFLAEKLTAIQLVGCGLILAAIILSQVLVLRENSAVENEIGQTVSTNS